MNSMEFEYGRCESSEWKDGDLLIQPDALCSADSAGNGGSEAIQPLGLYARPADPENGVGAGLLIGRDGDKSSLQSALKETLLRKAQERQQRSREYQDQAVASAKQM